MAAPNVGAHQSVQFGTGQAVSSGFFNPHPAPAAAPSFQPQAAFHGQPQFAQRPLIQRQPLVQPGFNGQFQGLQGRHQGFNGQFQGFQGGHQGFNGQFQGFQGNFQG